MLRRLRKMFRTCFSTERKSSKNIPEYEDPSGKLELENILGEGAFGQVYKGRHLETDEQVAIKVLNDEMNTEMDINNEIKLLKKYSKHENIASFFGVYLQPKGNLWIAMEYCEGGTVRDLMEYTSSGTLPEHWIAYIIREVLKALKYLHKNRVVHRDIKGHNIALTEDARVRLIDFGISQKLKGLHGACKDTKGTPHWLAPEVWQCSEDDAASYGCKCDIWSLGITAIEMAQGRNPLANLHGLLAGMKIMRCDPPTLRIPSKWSTEFNSFLGLCLKKDPKVRRSAKQLLKHPFVRNLENVKMVRAEMQAVICRVSEARAKKADAKPKEEPERISMGDFEKAMAELKSFQRDTIANFENLDAEAKKDATGSEELASQAEIDSANAEEPVDKKEESDALSNDEEKFTESNIEPSDATETVSQAKDSSDEELFYDALEYLSISDFTPKAKITGTAANTGDQAIKILEAINEEGAKRDGKAKEVIYTEMALFYFVRFALFLSEFLMWLPERREVTRKPRYTTRK